jgi:hypothetical protein
MMGINPLAIPLTHEYTKYPSVEEQVRGLINIHEEALATHEFAHQRMLQQITSNFEPFKLVFESPVWSGFLAPRALDQDQSFKSHIVEKTGPNWCGLVLVSLLRLQDRSGPV